MSFVSLGGKIRSKLSFITIQNIPWAMQCQKNSELVAWC